MNHLTKLAYSLMLGIPLLPSVNGQFPPFSVCTEGQCSDCPQSVTSGGTGYPACVVYKSDDVFAAGNFVKTEAGGYEVYFDVAEPGATCATIIKSPADASTQGCGTTIATFQNAACQRLSIKDTFMVQFCCGTGDCEEAGVGNAKRDELIHINSASSAGLFGASLKHANGTEIVPFQQGDMIPVTEYGGLKPRAECVYTADGGMEEYTRPADNTQIVKGSAVTGPGSIDITESRTQSWSTSMEAGVNIFEIVSASVSFEFSESITDSTTYSFSIPDGQTGLVGFTANLRCTTGTVDQCGDGASYHGETCTPYNLAGELSGTYAVIAAN